jgi:hypothetical protein
MRVRMCNANVCVCMRASACMHVRVRSQNLNTTNTQARNTDVPLHNPDVNCTTPPPPPPYSSGTNAYTNVLWCVYCVSVPSVEASLAAVSSPPAATRPSLSPPSPLPLPKTAILPPNFYCSASCFVNLGNGVGAEGPVAAGWGGCHSVGPSGEVLERLKGDGPGCRIIDDLSGRVLSKMGVKWAEEWLGAGRGAGGGGDLATLLPLRMTVWDYWSTLYDAKMQWVCLLGVWWWVWWVWCRVARGVGWCTRVACAV